MPTRSFLVSGAAGSSVFAGSSAFVGSTLGASVAGVAQAVRTIAIIRRNVQINFLYISIFSSIT